LNLINLTNLIYICNIFKIGISLITVINLRVTFLGTGTSQGVPVIACECRTCLSEHLEDKRLRSSILVEKDGLCIVIDTGPDFREQMLRENVKNLDAVLFTHEHRDHVAGLDDIRAYNFIAGKPVDVYGEERVFNMLKHEFSYIFSEKKYPGAPEINFHLINEEPFNIKDMVIRPIRALHYKLPVLGFRIDDFAYITDANFISDEEKMKLKDLKVFSVCALRKERHISHYTLKGALKLISEVKPRIAYLTHISHQMGLHSEIQKDLPENVFLAYDRLKVEI
jgi:phosphoribosyl 1,2-cyclic phosphate phosphodiesterase